MKSKTVVLFPIGSFYPAQTGGPNNTIYWICEQLLQEGMQPIILTTNNGLKPGTKLNTWLNEPFGKIKYVKTRFHYLPLRAFFELMKIIKQVDVIHLTALFYPQSIFAATLGLLYSKKIIWSPRGELEIAALQYSKIRKRVFLFLIKTFYKKKVWFHATSTTEMVRIQEVFGKTVKTFLLPNYLRIDPPVDAVKIRNFLYVGRIHPIKGIDILLKSCAKSKAFKEQQVKLIIAGEIDSPYASSLKDLAAGLGIKNQVDFVGHVEGVKKRKLFAESYFTFLLSKSENFGNVVVESMANKTPVIASKGTPWQLLEDRQAGFWVTADPGEIALLMDKILEMEPGEYDRYCENAYSLTKSEFDIKMNGYKWLSMYNGVTNG